MMGHAKIMYKSGGASSYCFGSEKSAVAGSSLISLVFSSLKMLPPLHLMQSPSDWMQLAGQLLREDSLPHSTGLFVPARHAGMSQNIGVDKI